MYGLTLSKMKKYKRVIHGFIEIVNESRYLGVSAGLVEACGRESREGEQGQQGRQLPPPQVLKILTSVFLS